MAIKHIKGMVDILPEEIDFWQFLERQLLSLVQNYGYQEIRTPILEYTSLFQRSIGEVTDIVTKEMYSFADKNKESLTMRPEGTVGCVRACLEHALLRNAQKQKLWYLGPMYRYERPQKGRYRQFFQFGIEAFNYSSPAIEAEHLAMMHRLWQNLGIAEHIRLEINNLGNTASRIKHRKMLTIYLQANYNNLDQDSKNRLETNPLRILDSKNPEMQNIIAGAPSLLDYLDEQAKANLDNLQNYLTKANINYIINPNLVRGLDYYNGTVYEWLTDKLGAQAAVCAGGSYDQLVSQLSNGATVAAATGFAMGLERILLLLREMDKLQVGKKLDGYLICLAPEDEKLKISEELRNNLPEGFSLEANLSNHSFKKQLKTVSKSDAKILFIIGDEELAAGAVSIKFGPNREQKLVALKDLRQFLLAENIGL